MVINFNFIFFGIILLRNKNIVNIVCDLGSIFVFLGASDFCFLWGFFHLLYYLKNIIQFSSQSNRIPKYRIKSKQCHEYQF